MKHANDHNHHLKDTSSQEEKDRLLALLERKHRLVGELTALVRTQNACVSAGDVDGLLSLLGKRQEVIDLLMEVQQETSPLAARIERSSLDESERQRAAQLMDGIKNGLTEVMKQDDKDHIAIRAAQGTVKEELRTLDRSQQVRSAYTESGRPDPRFADRKG